MSELTPLPQGSSLPAARDLAKILVDGIGTAVAEARRERGEVHRPEDTFGLLRSLARTGDELGEYGRAFNTAAKVVKQCAEEELIEATGENEKGEPRTNLTVPDAEGDFRVVREMSSSYSIDHLALVNSIVGQYVPTLSDHLGLDQDEQDALRLGLTDAMLVLLSLGSFTPQVTKVKAYSASLARTGDDREASVVNSLITRTSVYKGVKIERNTK